MRRFFFFPAKAMAETYRVGGKGYLHKRKDKRVAADSNWRRIPVGVGGYSVFSAKGNEFSGDHVPNQLEHFCSKQPLPG